MRPTSLARGLGLGRAATLSSGTSLPSVPPGSRMRDGIDHEFGAPEIVRRDMADLSLEQRARGLAGLTTRKADQRPQRVHRHGDWDSALALEERLHQGRSRCADGSLFEGLRQVGKALLDPGSAAATAASSRTHGIPQATRAQGNHCRHRFCFALHGAMIDAVGHHVVIGG